MGKQTATELSQEEYDSKLKSSISNLIKKGFSDEDINLYSKNYKTRFVVKSTTQEPVKKKEEVSTSVSEIQSTDTQNQDGFSENEINTSKNILQQAKDKDRLDAIDFRREGLSDLFEKLSTDERKAYNDFDAQKELTKEEVINIDNKIAEQQKGDFGFFGNIKNAIVSTPVFNIGGSFGKNPFFDPSSVQVQKKDELTKSAISKKQSEFLNELDDPDLRKKILSIKTTQEFRNNQEISDAEFMIDNIVSESNKLIESINLVNRNNQRLVDASENATTQEQIDLLNQEADVNNQKLTEFQEQGLGFQKQIEEELRLIEENTNNIGTFEDELGLLKRNYQSLSNAKNVVKLGLADVVSGLKFQGERAVNTLKSSPVISTGGVLSANPLFDSNAIEKKKAIEDKFIEERTSIGEFREFLEPETKVEDINSIGGAIDFAVEGAIENIPTLIQLGAGGVGQASFLLSQQAGNELDTRRDITESKNELIKIKNELKSNTLTDSDREKLITRVGQIEAQKELTELNIYLTSSALAGAELALGRLGRIRLLNKGKRVISSIGKNELVSGAKESLGKRTLKEVWDFTKDVTGEFVEEGTQQGLENANQIFNFNIRFNPDGSKKKLSDNVLEAGLKGLGTGTAISGTTKVLGHGTGLITDNRRRKKVTDNVLKTQELLESLQSTDLGDNEKLIARDKITELLQENESIIKNTIVGFNNLSTEEKGELRSINSQITALNISLDKIKKSKSLKTTSSEIISSIESQITELDEQKSELIYKNSPFSKIPKDDQVRLLKEAGDVLIKEQQDAGNTTFSISEEDTQNKAVEIFNTEKTTAKPIKSDFDDTLYNNKTGELTELGEEIKAKIQNGEDVTILTAREDTQENSSFIAEKLGISPDKIKLGLNPQQKADNVSDGDVFFDDNQKNIDAVSTTGAEVVNISPQTEEFADELGVQDQEVSNFIQGATKVKVGDTDIVLKSKGENIVVESIVTEKGQRGQGSGRNAIEKVVEVADNQNKTVELNVVPLTDDTNAEKLVTFYESVGFVKENGFDIDGGKMVRKPNAEQTFSDIVSKEEVKQKKAVTKKKAPPIKKPAIKENVYKSGRSSYEVNVVDGKLEITPVFGKKAPNTKQRADIISQYIERNDFDKGKTADFKGKDQSRTQEVVEETSENAREVAQEIVRVREANRDATEDVSLTKDGAIARALGNTQVDEDSYNNAGDRNNSVSRNYFNRRNKTGDKESIDDIRGKAQSTLGADVSISDVVSFMENNDSPARFLKESQQTEASGLDVKFQELTGLKPTQENVEKVSKTKNTESKGKTETAEDSDVPFQTESEQTKLKGGALQSLVDVLKKTGLAKAVHILTDGQVQSFLDKIGVNERLQKQEGDGDVNYEKWKGDRKELSNSEIQEAKTGEPVVVKAFHGTTNEFYEFDSTEKGNIEGHLGAVNYFTSDEGDADQNYQSDGSDLTSRIDRRAEQLEDELINDYSDNETDGLNIEQVKEGFNITDEEIESLYPNGIPEIIEAFELNHFIANRELNGENDTVLEVAIRMDNPVVLGENSSWIDVIPQESYEDSIPDAEQEIADENNITIEDAREENSFEINERAIELEGIENPLVEAMEESLSSNGYNDVNVFDVLGDSFYESEVNLSALEKDLRKSDLFENEDGELALSQVISDFFENLGYDGIILTDVSERFKGMGLNQETSHVHIFNQHSNNIKLTDGTNTTFNSETKDIRYQKELSNNGVTSTPNGFVYKDAVYLNSDKVKKDTPIHEFGHLWTEYIKENNSDVYDKGLELIKNSPYHKRVQNNPAYENLSEQEQLEEALAQAIGESGVEIQNESKSKYDQFKRWFKTLFTEIAKGLGIRNITPDKLANLTLQGFTRRASADLLAGKKIGDFKTKQPKTKVDASENTGIDFILSQQTAVQDAKNKLQESISNKNAEEKDVKKALLDYIRVNLRRPRISKIQTGQLTRLLRLYDKAVTENKLEKAIDTVDSIVNKLDKIEYSEHIKSLKARAIARQKIIDSKATKTAKKKSLENYLNEAKKGKRLSNPSITQAQSVFNAINNATTDLQYERALKRIDEFISKLENKSEKEQAIIDEKIRIQKEKLENKNNDLKERKKSLKSYIKLYLNNKNRLKLPKRKLLDLFDSTNKVNTNNQFERTLTKVENILVGANNNVLMDDVNSLLDAKALKVESGRLKAKTNTQLVDETNKSIIGDVRIKNGSVEEKRQELLDRQEELINKRDLIYDKLNKGQILTEQEVNNLFIYGLSINIIEANTTSDVHKAHRLLLSSKEALTEFHASQRNILKEQIEERNVADKQREDNWQESISFGNNISQKTNSDLKKERKSLTNVGKSFWNKISTGGVRFFSSLDELASILDRKFNIDRDSKAVQKTVNKIKKGQTAKTKRVRSFQLLHEKGIKSIYGNVRKSNITLGKRHTLSLDRIAINEETGEIVLDSNDNPVAVKVDLSYSVSELLNVWQMAKNKSLLSGLEASGFTKEVLQEIESLLPERVKKHGELLFELYEKMYGDANDVYKKMYFTDMGKPDFYSGKVYRVGELELSLNDLLESYGVSKNTGYGSQKQRTINNKPIDPKDVMFLFNRHLQESSHFVGYAEVHRELSRLLDSDRVQKSIRDSNGANANEIIDVFNKFKRHVLERDTETNKIMWLDVVMRNIGRAILSLKPIIGLKQTASIINGAFDMPTNLSAKERVQNFSPKTIYNSYLLIKNNSNWFQSRYDVGQMESTELGLSDLASSSNLTPSSNLNAYYQEAKKIMNKVRDMSMFFVKQGDKVGVMGALPVFNSWYNEYSKTLPHDEAFEKALAKFESTADRTQQSQTKAGKTLLQLNPILRYVVQFASAPIQNMQNARHFRRQLVRHYKTNSRSANINNALGYLNYRFAQPLIYTWVTGLLAGSLKTALGFDDEEPDDTDKDLLSGLIIGNFGAIPVIGDIIKGFVDKVILEKDKSWGEVMSAPVSETINKLQRELLAMNNAKSKEKQVEHSEKALKLVLEIGVGFPTQLYDMLNGDLAEIVLHDNLSVTTKAQRLLGYSYFAIENSRKKRISKEVAEKKKTQKDFAFERSEMIYNIQTGKKKYSSDVLIEFKISEKWQDKYFDSGLKSDDKLRKKFKEENQR